MSAVSSGASPRPLLAIYMTVCPLAAAGSMSYPLVAAMMEAAEISPFWIGLNGACAAVAMILASWVGPRFLSNTSVNRLMGAAIFCVVVALLLLPQVESYGLWTVLRLLLGLGSGLGYLATEFWIVSVAPAERRGRVVGFYALAVAFGMSIGPPLLWLTGTAGWAPFAAAAGVGVLSVVGLAWAWTSAPTPKGAMAGARAILQFFRTDPSVLWGVAFFGAVEAGAFGLIWVWSTGFGLGEPQAVAVVAALAIGPLLLQPLIGIAIDRMPPRPLLIMAAASCFALPLIAPALIEYFWALFFVMLLWGGLSGGLYSVTLATMGARYSGGDLASANSAIVAAYGIGALIGPLAVGAAMDAGGSEGLGWAVAVAAAAYLALLIGRGYARTNDPVLDLSAK